MDGAGAGDAAAVVVTAEVGDVVVSGIVEVCEAVVLEDEDELCTRTFCFVNFAVAFCHPLDRPSNMHRTSSWLPPAITTKPLGSSATA